jgi:hypothetical protein
MANRFFIAPYDENSGQQNNIKPWLIPDNAFETLSNAYVFRGRVRKRFGSRYFANDNDPLKSRLRLNVGTTDAAGDIPLTAVPTATGAIGQMFSIGTNIFTVYSAFGSMKQTTPIPIPVATFNTGTGDFQFTGADALTDIYWYPSLPVMGLLTYENSYINDEFTIAFDTRFAYNYSSGWNRITGGPDEWIGNDSDFFWGVSWSGADPSDRLFFVTNFDQLDPNYMRYYDGLTWTSFNPAFNAAGDTLQSARILTVFKNRLIALNTWEGGAIPLNYVNRARYSQIGDPLDATAWRQDIAGKGNAIDAPTREAIITVEFIKDRLIVYFERSTWELAYTGNQIYPFSWQKINTELGVESTFSIIPFDKLAIGVGNVGVHACNGSNVDRIDQKIPNEIFDIKNDNFGPQRVYGIRDYFSEMLYWTFPAASLNTNPPFPNKLFVYNYPTGTWSFNDDSITCFGYFQPSNGVLWSSTTVTWSSDIAWNSGSTLPKFQQVVAGNQQGYTFICDTNVNTNEKVLQITNVTLIGVQTNLQIIDHNLAQSQYIYIDNAVWDPAGNYLNDQIFQVFTVTDKDNILIGPNANFTGIYQGGGLISRVSQINIKTKQYNFYAKDGRNSFVNKVDFLVDRTANGQLDVNYYVSTSIDNLLLDSINTGTLLGTGTLDTFPYPLIPLEATSTRLWHPVYLQAEGEVIQLELTMNSVQMLDPLIRESGFQLHAMCIYSDPSSFRFQ